MANYNLTDQTISSSFQQLLQKDTDTGNLVDGLGNPIDSLTISGSTTSDFFIGDGSQLTNIPHTEIPQGTVSGSSQIDYPLISNIPSGIVSGSSQVTLEDTTFTDGIQFQVLRTDGAGNLSFNFADRAQIEIRTDETIVKGDPLYVTGFSDGENRVTVAKADASDPSKMPAYGIAYESVSQNTNTQMVAIGSLNDVNTQVAPNDFQVGETLYVNVGGGLTNVKPTGTNLIQNVGIVGRRNQNNGEILVSAIGRSNDVPNIQEGYVWAGNASGVATPISTGSFAGAVPVGVATTGSNTFNGDQTISGSVTIQDTNAPMSGLVLKNNSGGGDVQIIPEGDFVTTFNGASITGITNYGGSTLSGSWGTVGDISGPGIGIQNADLDGANQGIYLSHGNYDSWVSAPNGTTTIKGETIQLQPSSSAGTSVQVTGDVTASVFSGTFVGDGSGLTLNPNIAYKNVSNTFTQAQNINGVTTINDETADSNFKIFTVQKNNDDILTLFNSSSANNNEGELTLKGGLNVISEQGQNKIFVEDAGGNSAIIGTDSVGIKGASDSIPFTQLTAGGVWGRSLDSDNNNTALWISGTPTKINNYGYQLNSAYNDTVGVYTARGPQFGGTPAIPMFYQYISSSAEYLAGDASIHFGTTITADEGFRTLPSILGGTTPMEIFNSNGRKFEISAGALESSGEPAIQMYGDTRIEGNTIVSGSLTLMPNVPIEATQVQANESIISPFIESQTGTFTIGSNTVISGSVQLMPNVPLVATQVQANEAVVTPVIESSTGTITLLNNTIISGSVQLMPNVPLVATQIQANEAVVTPVIESSTGTITLLNNTIISGSLTLMPNVPIEATQVQANESIITPFIESSTGTVEFGSVIQLPSQDPLPTGAVGQLAVSASNLYFHNGTSWAQIN